MHLLLCLSHAAVRPAPVQDHHIHSFHFDDQYSTFNKFGYAVGPAGEACVGDAEAFEQTRGTPTQGCTDLAQIWLHRSGAVARELACEVSHCAG